jgi:hypothetical protein
MPVQAAYDLKKSEFSGYSRRRFCGTAETMP